MLEFLAQGYKYPVVTRDRKMVENKNYKRAGKVILQQPRKGDGEKKYKHKIKNYMSATTANKLKGIQTLIPIKGNVVHIQWVDEK